MLDAYHFLTALSEEQVIDLFWVALALDLPRYFLGFVAVIAWQFFAIPSHSGRGGVPAKVSVLVVGHNEEHSLERCVLSLREQSLSGVEIVCVDDGSADRTFSIMRRLERQGLVQRAVRLSLRGGKSAALNLAAELATGDIFIVVDCDCSFDRHALREIVAPFADHEIAAVCGNILARNWRNSLVASLQAIEYLVAISLGKTLADGLGQVTCVSGAFGAFRRQSWQAVGGQDVGPGEDLDFTFRLRLAGHQIRFARSAICYTDVPDTLAAFVRQRARWERDAFWIRLRKFGYAFNPFHQRFRPSELANQLDFLVFTLLPTVVFPAYLLYLALMMPGFAPTLIVAVTIGITLFELIAFALAIVISGRHEYWPLVLFIPLFGIFQAYFMRCLRLCAYLDELIFSRSLEDNYVPAKVRAWSNWR
ncbi:Glycosyltransferase, catalytic subunit of cellulose synthase and poly-beta-1,6-N-acetylglucosamine synthase [Bosea sp. CRIB-10]|uniref:glycosyltransferase n=1 Tax=Bosea sp. CRIB-10 TaxID=378404 RepID=UPI0008EF2BAA|nr:glycosyltransferase family 2 protein [Bosea sp. CRIB-10]SFC85681.1 Glycosyltransferase, catalytic subunit of cellulose synthase and poly-beta-1,6-N-acetylglucosamine synthase [Bosea sp. CRIB-10]